MKLVVSLVIALFCLGLVAGCHRHGCLRHCGDCCCGPLRPFKCLQAKIHARRACCDSGCCGCPCDCCPIP